MGRVKHQQSGRRKFYQKNVNHHHHSSSSSIQLEQHGFFVTYCASKESFVRNEIYNLLNRFGDQLYGSEIPETKDSKQSVAVDDFDSALENEAKQLNENKTKIRRFQIVKSGTKHSFFVRTTIPVAEINRLIETIFRTTLETKEQHSRYVERLLPVSFICKAYEDDLRKLIVRSEFIEQLLMISEKISNDSNTILFDVQVKKSNNNQVKSSHLEDILINDFHSRKTEDLKGKTLKRDYKKPEIHVLLHVIKSFLLVSIVRDFDLYKKYNLASLNVVSATNETQKTVSVDNDEQKKQLDENEPVENR